MLRPEPITLPPAALEEAKAYLRAASGDEDALIAGTMCSAAEYCEQFTRRALIARGFEELLPASAAWQRLGAAPVLAITGVEGLPSQGSAFALAAADFAVDIDSAGEGWVRVIAPGEAKRVRIYYQAGLAADWASAPEALRRGVLRLAGHLYAHREDDGDAGPPAAVAALWRPWRRLRLR
jgi:uncharacterized phiE125 gp8 family phage protein